MTDEITFGGDMTDIPAGTYPATLVGIATKTSDAWGDFRAWDFELENRSRVGAGSSMSMSPRSMGGKWCMALLGRKPEQGEAVGAAMIGRPCLVVVIEGDNGWPKVGDVLPPMAQGKARGKPTPEAEEPEAEAAPLIADALPF
jgi:hypothetical protein